MNIPACPRCGSSLTLRVRQKDGRQFFACTRYPECKFTDKLPAYAEMRKMGAPVLPGFEEISR